MNNEMSLYEIDKIMKEVLENGFSVNEETGEVFLKDEDLDKLDMAINDKINNIVGYIKDLDIQADNYKKVASDYQARSDNKKKRADRLRDYLSNYLQANKMTDKKEFKNGITSFRKSESLSITNDEDLIKYLGRSKNYKDCLKTKYEINKTDLKKYVKNGKKIPFCELVEKQNLQIK